MNRQAVINLSSRFVEPAPDEQRFEAAALRESFAAKPLRMIRAYDDVRLLVDSRDAVLSAKPILAGRLMARRSFVVEDHAGSRESISWSSAAAIVAQMLVDTAGWRFQRGRIEADVRTLEAETRRPTRPIGSGRPLYLRPDLWFGLRAGGSVGHIAGLVNAMQARGLNPLLVTTDVVPTVDAAVETILVRPKRRWLPVSEWQHLIFNRELVRAFNSVPSLRGERPSFIYQRHALHSYAGILLARRLGVPLVLEYNGSETWVANHWGIPLVEHDLATRIERVALAHADLVVAVSNAQRAELLARGVPTERILINPNAVDLDVYNPTIDGQAIRKRFGLGDSLVIGFIGTFGPWHGVEVLVEAFSRLLQKRAPLDRPVKLFLIGDGVRMPAIRAMADRLGLADAVRFAGLVPQAEGPAHLAAADILVAPQLQNADGSEFFGSPTKLFEYMAMGRAPVVSAVGQPRELVQDGVSGLLVPPGDAAALCTALERLIMDAELRGRLGATARSVAEAHHSHAARLASLLAALHAVAGDVAP